VPAHNYLLQIGTELGIVGLGLFLWALFGLARTAAGAAPGVPASDRWDRPAALGVAAFLISSLSGQPMLVDNVAIPAFLLMGICLVGAERPRPGRRALWIPVGGLAILATVPWRAALEVEQMDPRRTGYGTTFGEADDRRLVHFIDGPARLFAHRSAPFIRIEARALEGEGPNEVFLNVSGPGIVPRTFALRPDGSLTACIPLDPGAREPMGLRPLDVQVVQAGGAPAPPRSAWALVTGSERPCQ
jgi:hypothetical protein